MKYEDLRKELSHKERTIKDLVSYLETRTSNATPNYNVLIGAGASVSSGIRTGQDLVSEWRKDIYEILSGKEYTTEEDSKTYLMTKEGNWYSESNEYSSLFEKKFDLPSQRRRFVEKEVDKASPSIGYAYLTSLVDSSDRYIDTIFTTNFDDLINEAFYQFSQTRPIVCAHDSSIRSLGLSSSRPKIIKLHGDYLFDDIKSTLRETESLELNIKNKFIEFSKDFGLIVVGYAGHDRSIMDVINHLLKSDDFFKNGIYWCIRKDDYISSELRKLLWKDGVYFVLIDGFDEFFSEMHHKTKGPLSIKDKLSESKQDKILSFFTTDQMGLAKSSIYIAEDLERFKKHKSKSDISDMIRDLRDVDDEEISEDSIKILLNIETLIKRGELLKAKDFADESLLHYLPINIKSSILRKIIYIYKKLKLKNEAHIYCDKLINLDIFNYEYYIVKGDTYERTIDRCKYIKENIGSFGRSVLFNNYAAVNYIKNIKYSNELGITHDDISKLLETSLKLDPSLNNNAWLISLDLIKEKYKNKKNIKLEEKKRLEVNTLIEKAKCINDNHTTYFQLIDHIVNHNDKLEKRINNITIYRKAFDKAFLSKKAYLYRLICKVYLSFSSEVEKGFDYISNIDEFLNDSYYDKYDKKDESSDFNLLKAIISFNKNANINEYRELIIKASQCSDSISNLSNIVDSFLMQLKEPELAIEFVSKIKEEISDKQYLNAMSNIETYNNNLTGALEYIEEAYKISGDFKEYAQSKSFCLIKHREYTETVNFVCDNIVKIEEKDAAAVCKINKQLAIKLQGKDVDKNEIRNIIAKENAHSIKLACQCLLGAEVQIKRLIKVGIEYNKETIEVYKYWPVIDDVYMEEFNECNNVYSIAESF